MSISVRRDSTTGTRHTVRIRNEAFAADVTQPDGQGAATPHDLYDASLAACKALTVMLYAQRKNMPIEDIEVLVDRDDSAERKGVYRLKTSLRVTGALDETQRAELLRVAAKCPVHKLMTEVTTEIETGWA
ncbi:OsmC family protein [Variovorax arabinosiphilus]|uniref:OsmC family protein n=1 Tax=Variovorax arabinosiphilus TaxID=3053498 RepID=UPI0025758A66|nr:MULTISPECIES: OsmC family protein [unclassified Variovorax]MDM0120375.1 OsmC family protein [Variovorax sp. J2L1-78]MDM0127713.1 OsmC family protein [Variovorax sp. J2L1-63]MDM0231412.1 OsmC family protein [Variovorax sp. J2R1-6]